MEGLQEILQVHHDSMKTLNDLLLELDRNRDAIRLSPDEKRMLNYIIARAGDIQRTIATRF